VSTAMLNAPAPGNSDIEPNIISEARSQTQTQGPRAEEDEPGLLRRRSHGGASSRH